MMKDILSNCALCEEHSLHVIGEGEAQIMQCIWCGYVSSPKFKGTKEENKEYAKLSDEMKGWAKEAIGRIWIPSLFTLPDGMIYPENENGEMKWRLAELIEIPENEQKNILWRVKLINSMTKDTKQKNQKNMIIFMRLWN